MTRGEIWWTDYGVPYGSEPGFRRPAVIIQDDDFNRSNIHTIIVVPFSSNLILADAPGNVYLEKDVTGLSKDSVALVSQVSVVDKSRLKEKIANLPISEIEEIEKGIKLILNLR